MVKYTHTNFFDYLFEHTSDLEKLFILNPKEAITFRDLYHRCLKLAEYLNENMGTGQNILILCPNSQFFITVYLGTIKSGNVIVPLNYEIEQRNLDYILNLCESKLVFTTSQYKQKLDFRGTTIIDESALEEILQGCSPTPNEAQHPHTINDLAEIIFTSGSTGEPKGVMISHKNLIANTWSILEYLKLKTDDIILVVLPFYYCYGLSLLHTHLRVGGSIALNNMFIMLGGVINDLKKYRCTGFAGVPSHFQILLRKSDSFKTTSFPDLRYVTQAGGKLHNAFVDEFICAFPKIYFYIMYGQTEATARLTWLDPDVLIKKIGSCGKAIPGVVIRIANDQCYEVKQGEIGEIIASGDNISSGYYKDSKSTEQALIKGWLHTGDLGSMDQDGYIFLSARKKEIIKVGGRRISPKEIEEVILNLPEVVDCTIEGVHEPLLGETIKAIVVLNETSELVDEKIIRNWCSKRLASYKIPQIIEFKKYLDISVTGKKVKR